MLDLQQLAALNAVRRTGSVCAAADELHITPSAASQRLTKLSNCVGSQLFERNGQGLRFTEAALLLDRYSEKILQLVKEAEDELGSQQDTVSGRLTVAGFSTAIRCFVSDAVRTTADRYPELHIELSEMEPDRAVPLVSRGDFEVAVVQDWDTLPLHLPESVSRTDLLDDNLDIALPAKHPLADREVINFNDLAGDHWVSWPADTVCANWLVRTLRSHGLQPNIVHTAAEYATQLSLVAAGFGVAAVPRLGRDPIPLGVRIVSLEPGVKRHIYAIWRAGTVRRAARHAIVTALRTSAPSPTCATPSVRRTRPLR
jgi:DNA-binding transcriptional LysR family regulator